MTEKGKSRRMGNRVRVPTIPLPDLGRGRRRHLQVAKRLIDHDHGVREVVINEGESPLGWLARRRDRSGRAMINAAQLQAGERLRTEFTRAQMMARTTANWEAPISNHSRRSGSDRAAGFADAAISARQTVHRAMEAVGPEFAGLLLDVCCFLKGLEVVERERRWPPRSAKVVLQLGLDRLARHFGYCGEARGPRRAAVRTWLAEDAAFVVDGE